jgi:hypothetical protein
LILLDPWGIPKEPKNLQKSVVANIPWFAMAISAFAENRNGLNLLRALGPFVDRKTPIFTIVNMKKDVGIIVLWRTEPTAKGKRD